MPNRIQSRSWRGLDTCTEAERRTIAARFWSHVNKTDGCWLWTWSAQDRRGGHGQLRVTADRHVYLLKTHRLAWEFAYGRIPDGLQVCHHCDVPRCVRPEHLFLGTQDDNLKDAARKGRFHQPRTRTLSQADRLAIYSMPDRRGVCVALALHYGVSKSCISLIRRGRFVGSPMERVFTRVPHVTLPIRGEVA